jgi:predicted nucleic acid-binding protein
LKIYLDTSVINIYLFGKYSTVKAERFLAVSKLFEIINSKRMRAIVSLYSIQEIYSFCKRIFSPDNIGHISRVSLSALFENEFELAGLLSREERLLNRTKFNIDDPSDQPHAISAFLNKCDAIITYDKHFQKISDILSIYTPEEVIPKFS